MSTDPSVNLRTLPRANGSLQSTNES